MKQFVVVGLGRFGASVARTLIKSGHEVLAIDIDADKISAISNDVTHAVQADATDGNTLDTLGVRNFDVAVVSIGNDIHANVLVTLVLKEAGVPYVVVKAQDNLHGSLLTKVGADRIVYPERDMGARAAHNLISSNVLDYLEFPPDYSIVELSASGNFVDKSLSDLKIRSNYNVNIIAIKRGRDILISPGADEHLGRGDVLVVMGRNEDITQIQDYMSS